MAARIVIGKEGGDVGLWVAPPSGDATVKTGRLTVNSGFDMLKLHQQGSVTSTGTLFSVGPGLPPYHHSFQINYTDLGYIPLALFGLRLSAGEPFEFPPNLESTLTTETNPRTGLSMVVPARIIVMPSQISFAGWHYDSSFDFNYAVFKNKIRDAF